MNYFGTQQRPLAGYADIFRGGTTDFQSILNADLFDLGTPSELTETTAAPATGPSGSLGADAERPVNPYGLDPSKLSEDSKVQLMLFDKLVNQRSTAEDDERRFRMIQTLQREDAERADKMGRRNYDKALLGSLIQKIPEAMTNMAMAGTAHPFTPINAARYGREYFT
jgi:hypothetical protein